MSAFRRRTRDVAIVAVLSVVSMFACGPKTGPQVMNKAPTPKEQAPMKTESPIRVIAFTEQPVAQGQATLLVQIINQSQAPLAVWNDLDSINIPQNPPGDGIAPSTELTHYDFGTSGSGQFVKLAPGECVKVSRMLRDQQLIDLDRVKAMKIPVKVREGDQADAKTMLIQGNVYRVRGA